MDAPSTAPLKRALVRRLRNDSELAAALKGGINQRTAPRKLKYPYLVYSEVSAPFREGQGVVTCDALYDISIVALTSVEAENLDQLVAKALSGRRADKELQPFLDGQMHVQKCDRVATMPTGPERNALGQRVVQIGGTYNIVLDFPLGDPAPPGP